MKKFCAVGELEKAIPFFLALMALVVDIGYCGCL